MTVPAQLTKVQKVVLAVGVPLTVATIGWTGFNEVAFAGSGTEQINEQIPVRDQALSLHIDEGNISLRAASDGTARLTGTIHYSLIRPSVNATTGPSGTDLSVACQVPTGFCSLNSQLGVPAGTRVDIGTSMGDITAQGITVSDVSAHDDMGDITLTFTTPPKNLQVSDSMGDITIVLPRDSTKYRVNAHSDMGDATVTPGLNSDQASNVIDASSSMGDVTISTRPAA